MTIKDFSNWLRKISTGWVTLLGLAIFIPFTALVLPAQAAKAEVSAPGAGSPDTSFFYSPDELYGMAEAYGEAGRAAYIRARLTFDVVWPLVYAFFLATSISWLSTRGFESGSVWQRANLVPIFGMVFDALENLATSWVMYRFPLKTPVIAALAPVFTMVKWVFVSGSFVLLLVVAGACVRAWIRDWDDN